MKNIFKSLAIVAVAIFVGGCSSRQNEYNDVETISIQVSDTASNMSAFERFDFVKLEMTSESLLPDIAKVVTTDDRIYVLSMMDARIFIFSNQCNIFFRQFIYKIYCFYLF